MWPRVVELMLACWLAVSPFVFRGTGSAAEYVVSSATAAALIVAASLASFWRPLRRASLATLLCGIGVAAHGYLSAPRPGPPAAQNEIVVGLLLILFAIIPTEANRPPQPWRREGADDEAPARPGA